jgi:hypothetical protein
MRRTFLYSITFFFIIAAPAALFYAWGYSFDWQNKKPVLTGGFYLQSIPKKAEIYIDGKKKSATPAFIKRLIPREYEIKISKQGYHFWKKTLKIESKLVTEAKNIILIPLVPKVEIIQKKLENNFSLKKYLGLEEFNDAFYIQKPSYILYENDLFNMEKKQMSLAPLPADDNYEIFSSTNKKVAVLNSKQDLYLLNPDTKTFELIGQNVKGLQFSNDNRKLLYFTPSEIWVYYLEDIFSQPNKKAGNQELITRLSQEIKQAVWYGQTNEHIIFTVGQNIKFVELDGRNERNTIDVIKTNIEKIAYSLKDKKLYFIKKIKGQSPELWRISL